MHSRFTPRFAAPCALLTWAVLAAPLLAQEDADDEADHEALRQMRAVVEEAINTNQLELIKPYLADEFRIVTYTDREFTDFNVFKTRWQKTRDELLAGGSYSTKLNPIRSRIIGDIAIAGGNADNVLTTGSGQRYEFPSHWTAVLQKLDGQWKILAVHCSLSPFDNPMLKAGVERAIWNVGAGGLGVGLIAGCLGAWLVGRMRRRKPSRDAPQPKGDD